MLTIKTDELDSSGEVHISGCEIEFEDDDIIQINGAEESLIYIHRTNWGFSIRVYSSDASDYPAQELSIHDDDYIVINEEEI